MESQGGTVMVVGEMARVSVWPITDQYCIMFRPITSQYCIVLTNQRAVFYPKYGPQLGQLPLLQYRVEAIFELVILTT